MTKTLYVLILALLLCCSTILALTTYPGTHANVLSFDGLNIVDDYRVNTALMVQEDFTVVNQTSEDFYSILDDSNYSAADLKRERIIFNFVIDTNYLNMSYPNPTSLRPAYMIPYNYHRWADLRRGAVVDWDNTDLLQKSVKFFGAYALECVGNNLEQCSIVDSFYSGTHWEVYYTYKFQKTSVCNSYVLQFLADKNSYFNNASTVRENECSLWDKNWVRGDIINTPSYAFSDAYHAYPTGINFGEPPVLITDCRISCQRFPDEENMVVPDITKKFDYASDAYQDCPEGNTACLYESKYYRSGIMYQGGKGTTLAQGTVDCGDFPPYVKNINLDRNGFEMKIVNTCSMTINPAYRGKNVLDTTSTFSSLFSASGYSELMSAGKNIQVQIVYGAWVDSTSKKIMVSLEKGFTQVKPGTNNGNGGYTIVTNVTGVNQTLNISGDLGSSGASATQLVSMANTNLELETLQQKIKFFDFMLLIIDFFVSVMVVVTYLFEFGIIVFILFVAVPGVFTRTIKLFKDITKVQR
jgi:hypothetical protein